MTVPSEDPALAARSEARRRRMETNRAPSFEEADAWDLAYWQRRPPEARLDAWATMRADLARIRRHPSADG